VTFVTFGCGLLFLPVLESAFGCDTSHIYNCSYDDANASHFDNVSYVPDEGKPLRTERKRNQGGSDRNGESLDSTGREIEALELHSTEN
jgi:hypothetical protein